MKPVGPLAELSSSERARLEWLLMEFEMAWTPELFQTYCRRLDEEVDDRFRRAALAELTKIDLYRQWSGNRPKLVEQYIAEERLLGTPETVDPEIVLAEIVARRLARDNVSMQEYARRFPRQFEAVLRMADETAESHADAIRAVEREESPVRGTLTNVDDDTTTPSALREHSPTARDGPPTDDRVDLPDQLGRYRVLRKLGAGAMGTVYLALDTELHRHVALKTPMLGNERSGLVERFYREARAAGRLHHRNICPVYDVGEIDGRYFISMAYVRGRTMVELTKPDSLLPVEEAAWLIQRLAMALREAHRHNVVHRDLKPANIIIDSDGEPVIMDFGLAHQSDLDLRVTRSGAVLGTPAYMAPEQIEPVGNKVSPVQDIYSLGVIFYELLTGRLPFDGSLTSVLYQIVHREPTPPSMLRSGIPPAIEAVCLKMMAKDPRDRYESAEAVACDLEAARAEKPLRHSSTGTRSPASGRAATARRGRRHRWWVFGSAVAGFLICLSALLSSRWRSGTIRLEVVGDATDLEVRIDNERIPISGSQWSGRRRHGVPHTLAVRMAGQLLRLGSPTNIRLPDGRRAEYRLTLELNGKELLSHSFRLERNRTTVIRIVCHRKIVPVSEPSAEGTGRGRATRRRPPPAMAPFDARRARWLQEQWADYLGVPIEIENSIDMKLALIPPGIFVMGDEEFATPRHVVAITRPFYMGRHEVTQQQYLPLLGMPRKGFLERVGVGDNLPAYNLSYGDAVRFCRLLSSNEQRTYRLPTEAEWEYACRAGTTGPYHYGPQADLAAANYSPEPGKSTGVKPVGSYPPNPFDLFDMHGNVWEWCSDWFAEYAAGFQLDPTGAPSGKKRVLRGGAWSSTPAESTASAYRFSLAPRLAYTHTGLRVVLEIPQAEPIDALERYADVADTMLAHAAALAALDAEQPKSPPLATAPFDIERAREHQRQWADHLGVPVEFENSIGMKLVLIPPGTYLRGSPADEVGRRPAEGPQRRIEIPRALYMGIHEVTQAQYRRVTGTNPSYYSATGGGARAVAGKRTDRFPVENVSWNDAVAFCRRLSERAPEKRLKRAYRLPTEAEWEYACRAGTVTPFVFGESLSSTQANFKGKYPYGGAPPGPFIGHPTAVGSYPPNPFGLFDMHGNVWEWCHDWLGRDYYAVSPPVDPLGPLSGRRHVFRGGGWGVGAAACRSACRARVYLPRQFAYSLGFRVVVDLPPATPAQRPLTAE